MSSPLPVAAAEPAQCLQTWIGKLRTLVKVLYGKRLGPSREDLESHSFDIFLGGFGLTTHAIFVYICTFETINQSEQQG